MVLCCLQQDASAVVIKQHPKIRYAHSAPLTNIHTHKHVKVLAEHKDEIKHRKLLPKFGKSMEKPWGISVLKEILMFYSEDVFSKESLKAETANNDVQLLISTLEAHVDYCLVLHPGALNPKERSEIEDMKRTFTELKELGVYKAVGEFKTVLDWIETYIHARTGNWKSRGRGRP
ncbi:hypothetical protein AAFF_G00369180 [Aldrovandia affinis]|uniref:Interleukin family protein n=1 Tax=Aldrovandia affinis TaxID=143900 RepID=A0AAD7SH54_9TELE|nr:hypothetical protein AAFF_G00369180 [Aldrovandia affinis]